MLALYNVHVPQSKEDIILEAEKIFGQTNIQFPLRQLYLEFLICSDMDFPLTASRFLTGSNLSLWKTAFIALVQILLQQEMQK